MFESLPIEAMSKLIKINEGEVISSDEGYGIRVSHNRVSYSEKRKTVAFFDAEHTANPYQLHFYANTLTFSEDGKKEAQRKELITRRVVEALGFLGSAFVLE